MGANGRLRSASGCGGPVFGRTRRGQIPLDQAEYPIEETGKSGDGPILKVIDIDLWFTSLLSNSVAATPEIESRP